MVGLYQDFVNLVKTSWEKWYFNSYGCFGKNFKGTQVFGNKLGKKKKVATKEELVKIERDFDTFYTNHREGFE